MPYREGSYFPENKHVVWHEEKDDPHPGKYPSAAALTALKDIGISVVFDAPADADYVDVIVPFAGTITSVTLLADQSGSIAFDIWKDTYANFPPTVDDSIVASAPPTISSATKSQDTTLTGWTTAVAAGDILRFYVDGEVTTITRCTLALGFTRS